MPQRLDQLKETPSQTAGPYVHIGTNPNWVEITGVWERDLGLVLVAPETIGERILVRGRIFDGAEQPADRCAGRDMAGRRGGPLQWPGREAGPSRPAFRRLGPPADDAKTGEFRFETIKPGRVPYRDGRLMAPHI